ncbi:hypothetical protein B0H13DRAFT_1867053 [Mycena leptocephala]|nr:hypothetical protein B0H13DRAFT_1867053 [Mycena leptocephala]
MVDHFSVTFGPQKFLYREKHGKTKQARAKLMQKSIANIFNKVLPPAKKAKITETEDSDIEISILWLPAATLGWKCKWMLTPTSSASPKTGLNIRQAAYAVKKYPSHRRIPASITKDAEVIRRGTSK